MNKKADIAITILVVVVIVLCAIALFSFYVVEKKKIRGGIDSFFYLQDVYNLAESVRFSGAGLYESYEDDNTNIEYVKNEEEGEEADGEEQEKGEFMIKKEFFNGDLKITYKFAP